MVGRHDEKTVLLDKESPDIAHDGLLTEKGLISRRTAEKDHLRADQSELLSKQRLACMDLRRRRTPVLGRTAFRDITDVIILFCKAIGVDEILQELARSSDEGTPLKVLLLARGLADYHEGRVASASVDDNVGAAGPKIAIIAHAALRLEFFPL